MMLFFIIIREMAALYLRLARTNCDLKQHETN